MGIKYWDDYVMTGGPKETEYMNDTIAKKKIKFTIFYYTTILAKKDKKPKQITQSCGTTTNSKNGGRPNYPVTLSTTLRYERAEVVAYHQVHLRRS